ncbi:MAG: hypothetical protein ACKOU6_05835, partial [Planctomycetota bacterium]
RYLSRGYPRNSGGSVAPVCIARAPAAAPGKSAAGTGGLERLGAARDEAFALPAPVPGWQ